MAEVKKFSLTEKLKEADRTLMGSPSLLGMTALTYPNYVNAMRSTMFTSHLKQFLNLLYPESPFVFTNNENTVGELSSGYYKAKHNLRIYRKINKFEDIMDEPSKVVKVFIYDKDEKTYDVIERKECEDLTENFGYEYINDVIDSLEDGDEVKKGEVLYRSTSYDEDMNYGYGRNVTVAYTLDPYTSEDAAIASKRICPLLASIESDKIKIPLNGNDYLINKYGDDLNYKPLPDIGEKVSGRIAVSRRQFNNQLLFDFKDDSLQEIHEGDIIFYVDDDVEVLDYTIYDNRDEEIDNPFYEQINKYAHSEEKYYSEIIKTCKEIMNSGEKYTRNIDYLYKRALAMLDKKKKWKESNDSVFGNMEIEISIRRKVPLAKGCKITGRYGNKSVIAEIWDDEKMPRTADGRQVDILLNLLAIINRTTAFPLYELFITGSAYQVRQYMKTLPTLVEKENTLFKFIRIFNEKQDEEMYADYKKLSKSKREEYIEDAIENGIYIHQTPMWESFPIFYRCQNLLREFPFIKRDTCYITKWNREIKILSEYFIGEMYIMKLKQSDRRGFSARSTGALDNKSLPTKSLKNKTHQERISSSCIRFGEYETYNFLIALLSEDTALFHALYRTSTKGRKDLIKLMFSGNLGEDAIGQIDASYTNRVAEIFEIILKALGIKCNFIDDDDELLLVKDNKNIGMHTIEGKTYFCTDYQAYLIQKYYDIKEEILLQNPIMLGNDLYKSIEKEMKIRALISSTLKSELGIFTDTLNIDPLVMEEEYNEDGTVKTLIDYLEEYN